MQVKRFLAADMRRALEMVRQELGPDAIILSSHRTPEGVELLTTRATPDLPPEAPADEMPSEAPRTREASDADGMTRAPETGRERADAIERALQKRLAGESAQRLGQKDLDESAREYLQPNQKVNAGIRVKRSLLENNASSHTGSRSDRAARPMSAAERYPLRDEDWEAPVASRASEPRASSQPESDHQPAATDPRLESLQTELAEMRYLLEEQLSKMIGREEPPRSPTQSSVARRLERMGLPAEVVAPLLESAGSARDLGQAWNGALARLARELPAQSEDPVAQGGTFALVGPTGAGKTTTIGKLAARYVMANGPQDVALVTLDTHRIGGHDQLRSLARILGVTFKVVDDQQTLDSVLYSLRRYSLVLIDTAGFRQGDARLTEQMQSLARQARVKPLLVLPGNSQPAVLKASLHAYGEAGLAGCILSKLDESASLGEALGVVMQGAVPIVYTTHGQDIPRDIEVARAHQLVTRAASLIRRATGPAQSQSSAGGGLTARAV